MPPCAAGCPWGAGAPSATAHPATPCPSRRSPLPVQPKEVYMNSVTLNLENMSLMFVPR
jgi:hypothetical protein